MCVLIFSTNLSETFLITRIIERDMIINLRRSSCKVAVFLSYFNETWIFSIDFLKTLKYQISWKSVHWGPSCSMRTDRQTDMKKLASQFCESTWKMNPALFPKTKWHYLSIQCSPISVTSLLFGYLAGFTQLSFSWEQYVDENKYGALVEW